MERAFSLPSLALAYESMMMARKTLSTEEGEMKDRDEERDTREG